MLSKQVIFFFFTRIHTSLPQCIAMWNPHAGLCHSKNFFGDKYFHTFPLFSLDQQLLCLKLPGAESYEDHPTMIRAGIKRPHSPVLRTHFNAHSQYLHRGLQNSRIIRAPIFTIFLRRRIKNVPLIQEGGTAHGRSRKRGQS